jgi:hypothetical protein
VRYGDLGEGAMYIAKRIGRGFVPALFVVDQPNYEGSRYHPQFDIQGIATKAFKLDFPLQFQKQLDYEMSRRS